MALPLDNWLFKQMKIVNLISGPGSGKSTTAALLFGAMKLKRVSCELTLEYAKKVVYEGHFNILSDQFYIAAKQNRQLERLRGHVDYVISDSPLILSNIYGAHLSQNFRDFVMEMFNSYDNEVFFIKRVKPYVKIGRTQEEHESDEISRKIENFLRDNKINYKIVDGDENAPHKIMEHLGLA